MRAREEEKTQESDDKLWGLGWISGLRGQEQDMISLLVMGTILLVIIIIYLFKRYSTCSRLQRILCKLFVRGSGAFMRNVTHEAHEV